MVTTLERRKIREIDTKFMAREEDHRVPSILADRIRRYHGLCATRLYAHKI